MKKQHICIVGLASILLFVSSCSKDKGEIIAALPADNSSELIYADRWLKQQDGSYSNIFANLLLGAKYAGINHESIKVYLVLKDHDVFIGNGGVIYLSGNIRAEKTENDLNIFYNTFPPGKAIPFRSLTLRITTK